MPSIFISYRRADTTNITDNIHRHLASIFGKDSVFQDVMSIDYGADFRRVLAEQVNACDVLLVIIGKRWANIREVDEVTGEETDRLRLFNENDFVRIEVETGLNNPKTLVIPVLVNEANLPRPSELPESLQDLRNRNAATVRNNPYFENDIRLLVRQLRKPRYPLIVAAVFGVVVIIAGLLLLFNQPNPITEVQRALTSTVEAQIAVIVTDFAIQTGVVQTAIATFWTAMPSITPLPSYTPTPTMDQAGTATAQAGHDMGATQAAQAATDAQATNNALAAQNAPTNTPPPTETPTPTLTATPTPTPTATVDIGATATEQARQNAAATQAILNAQATIDAQATIGQMPTLVSIGMISSNQNINMRSGPSTNNMVVAVLSPGTQVVVLEMVGEGAWYHLRLQDGREGYVAITLVEVIGTPTVTPTLDSLLGLSINHPVIRNAQWTPRLQIFENVEMVLVPAGCFEMGNDSQAYYWKGNNNVKGVLDGGKQCFDRPFWIDKYEVTNAQFASFNGVAATLGYFSSGQLPRENITWFEARDYCQLRGARLPREAEWEYAARGPDGLAYPWGNDFIPDNVVSYQNSNNETADVESKPGGQSWVMALGMSGNVWEWTATVYRDYPYVAGDSREEDSNSNSVFRTMRGGSFFNLGGFLRASNRGRNVPDNHAQYVGFRCARDYEG
jgi:formylglycine-generating enzyme required for sulfatase activity